MSMGTWQEGMLLQLESASSSRAHWEPCAAAVSDAVGSLSSVVQRNRNEGGRVEGAQAVLRARSVRSVLTALSSLWGSSWVPSPKQFGPGDPRLI